LTVFDICVINLLII